MKNQIGKIVTAALALGIALSVALYFGKSNERAERSSPAKSASMTASTVQRPVLRQKPVTVAASSSENAHEAASYFHSQLEGIPAVGRIYKSVRDRLPAGEDSELLSVYVAESIARNGSTEFAHFMTTLHAALRDRSLQLYDLMLAQEDALKQDAFVYQMALNAAAKLNLPGEMKARLLGGALDNHFEPDAKMGVTAMTTNITNALILMKNYGITAEQAAPYIQHGVQVNQDDPQALAEFAARANTYYPGSVAVR